VMTSGNATDEPICVANDEAVARLRGIADAFVVHDREIVSRYDDSVVWVRPGARGPSVLRRARSSAPAPVELAVDVRRPILGVGAELHGAFCLAKGHRAFLSQHVGDLISDEAMIAYRAALDRYRSVFRVEPELVAHDLHPDLLSTRFAEELGLPRVAVQHHHAHVAATMAEHGLDGEVVGLALDGLGFGDDGTIWGGELLICSRAASSRIGRLRPVRQPGGDAATRDPVRMAIAHARDAGVLEDALELLAIAEPELDVVLRQIETGFASPLTSSAGRLFDAVAVLVGVCRHASFEGQPAILLEQAADPALMARPTAPVVELDDGTFELDTRPLVAAAVSERRTGVPAAEVAGRFHAGFSALVAQGAIRASDAAGLDRVVLGGGVFHNDLLVRDLADRLAEAGLHVFLPRDVPVGDGGIALGQVLVAHARTEGVR